MDVHGPVGLAVPESNRPSTSTVPAAPIAVESDVAVVRRHRTMRSPARIDAPLAVCRKIVVARASGTPVESLAVLRKEFVRGGIGYFGRNT